MLLTRKVARGFTKSSQGNPDEARAARHILKDYVNVRFLNLWDILTAQGKLLFVHPPPGDFDSAEFNQELYENEKYIKRKQKEAAQAAKDLKKTGSVCLFLNTHISKASQPTVRHHTNADMIDTDFFTSASTVHAKTAGKYASQDFVRPTLYPSPGSDPSSPSLPPKKNHKRGKKSVKQRTAWTEM